jgi:hypothetical protein
MVAYQEQVPWLLVCEFEGLRVMGAHYGTVAHWLLCCCSVAVTSTCSYSKIGFVSDTPHRNPNAQL